MIMVEVQMSSTGSSSAPIIMRPSPFRRIVLVIGIIFLMSASLFMLFAGNILEKAIGLFGLLFFGWAVMRMKNLGGLRVAGLTLHPHGLQCLGWNLVIPWSEIVAVGVTKIQHNRCVGFNVADYNRFAASIDQRDLQAFRLLQKSVPGVVALGVANGEFDLDVLAYRKGGIQEALAASRRQTGWDLHVMSMYLDRSVDDAAALVTAVREQQAGPLVERGSRENR